YTTLFRSPMDHLMPWHIDAAMYGDRVVHVALAPGVSVRPDRYGGGRTFTRERKTYISAVAVISDHDDRTVIFYHNCFAERPLPRAFFSGPQFYHLQKEQEIPGKPWEWVRRV